MEVQRLAPLTPTGDALVSIIIPCHGHAQYLAEAIDSARAQTHPAVEVIVVDDGSPDDTAAVATSYDDVQLVRQPNRGLSAARNAGLAVSTGTHVLFLDADDVLRPEAVEAGLAAFERRPNAGFVAGAHIRVDRDRSPSSSHRRGVVCEDPYEMFLHGNSIGMHATVLYRRDAIESVGGFDPSLSACEDYDAYLRLSRHLPVVLYDDVVAEYRRHDSNMSGDPVRMLTMAHRALRRQWTAARTNPAHRAAYRAGMHGWTELYLNEYLHAVHGRRMTWLEAMRHGVRLVCVAPGRVGTSLARRVRGRIIRGARRMVRNEIRRRLRHGNGAPPVGAVRMGDLRRVRPISDVFGFDRGRPVDRHYIERFLETHADDIRGRVLEIGDATYTRRYGRDRVTRSDVLHVTADNPAATLVGDLADGDDLPTDAFDCIICTQTLHLVYDVHAGLGTLLRMLAPGGVLLLTVPGITQVDRDEWGATWCWSFTPYALNRLLLDRAPDTDVTVTGHGNVLAATAFLHGLADAELTRTELEHTDDAYPLVVTARVERR